MKVWAIIWRIVWVLIAATALLAAVETFLSEMGEDIVMAVLGFCLTCIIVNIPIYILTMVRRDAEDELRAAINWELHPIATLLINIILAPVITIVTAIRLTIQVIGLLAGKYDI